MFYRFAYVVISVMLRIFFRKLYISGKTYVKKDKPQLIASNHPNGFIEPLVMACYFPKALYFLVRGDVFDNPFIRPVLRATNQIPIFRFRDGFSRLRENSAAMDESHEVLRQGKNLLIFAEGGTESVKKLRPLQKGIARIAFQVMESNPGLPLQILPVGVNFTYPEKFGEEVMLRIGKPLEVSDYLNVYKEDKNKGTELLLEDLYNAIRKNIIHLEDQQRHHVFEKCIAIYRAKYNSSYLALASSDDSRLEEEKMVATRVDELSEPALEEVRALLARHDRELKNVRQDLSYYTRKKASARHLIWLSLLSVPALAGLIFHGPMLLGASRFTQTKVRHREFKLSILLVSSLILFLLTYILAGFLCTLMPVPWYTFFVIPLSGAALYSWHMTRKSIHFLSKKEQETQGELSRQILTYVT